MPSIFFYLYPQQSNQLMNLKEIESLIKFVSKSGVSEVELETKDVKITIKTENGRPAEVQSVITQMPMQAQMPNMQMAPVNMGNQAPAAPQEAPKAEAPKADDSKLITVKSPMIGTFYRSSSPDKPAFINVGDSIKPGDVVCIIEAMKLFNEIESEISGKVVKVLVDDSSPVEYDQPLFLVEPA